MIKAKTCSASSLLPAAFKWAEMLKWWNDPVDLCAWNPKPDLSEFDWLPEVSSRGPPMRVWSKPRAADISLGLFPCHQTLSSGPKLNCNPRAARTNTLAPPGGPGQNQAGLPGCLASGCRHSFDHLITALTWSRSRGRGAIHFHFILYWALFHYFIL